MLYFGLESANDRILGCMDKGIKKENVLNICKYCADAGIWTHLFLIFGFPTETREEARETMDFILRNIGIVRSMSFGSFQLTKHSKVYEKPRVFDINTIIKNDSLDLLWYEYDAATGISKKETDEIIQGFYDELSIRYRDFPIWSNLDREHLFLYIAYYKKNTNKIPDLSKLVDRVIEKRINEKHIDIDGKNNFLYPDLNEGIFAGTFNFNWAQLHQAMMSGSVSENGLEKQRTNVLFDTNNNRIFTIPDFAKDILDACNGKSNLPEIIDIIRERYHLTYPDAEFKIKNFLKGLMDKNIIIV